MLMLAHDLGVVRFIADQVIVMYLGRGVEIAPTGSLFSTPIHPYAKALLSAVPVPEPGRKCSRILSITTAFPDTTVQTCVRHCLSDQWHSNGLLHLVYHSPNFCVWKDRKSVAPAWRRAWQD